MEVKKLVLSIFISVSLLVAFAGSCFNIDVNPDKNKETKETSKKDGKPSDHQNISIDLFNAIVQAGHIIFHSDFSFEINLPDETGKELSPAYQAVLLFTAFHKTLFQQIISPNAP
jgi:hypothetical protein